MKRVLLVKSQPSKFPPLGLLKLATMHAKDDVILVEGSSYRGKAPDTIYVDGTFTFMHEHTDKAIQHYLELFPSSLIIVGGIYATLCSDSLRERFGKAINVHVGLSPPLDAVLPNYALWDESTSYVASSRGCIRRCDFCSVTQLEPEWACKRSILPEILPTCRRIVVLDNNILANPYVENILDELREAKKVVDITQGIDARLLTEGLAQALASIHMKRVRLAYDAVSMQKHVTRAVERLKKAGFPPSRIMCYCMYATPGKKDTPHALFHRLRDLMRMGIDIHPCRYRETSPVPKNFQASKLWEEPHLSGMSRFLKQHGIFGTLTAKRYGKTLQKLGGVRNLEGLCAL